MTKNVLYLEYEGRKITAYDCDKVILTDDTATILNNGTKKTVDLSGVKDIHFTHRLVRAKV